ncbi:MAG: type II secretion system protein [Proteobacteria bacterium]|nr:type II secretion system protein [Pseudomonadota bacterium]
MMLEKNGADGSPGFTLLEVLIAFSLLSILLTVLIQSQGDNVFFLEKTKKMNLVQKEVINELLRTERDYSGQEFSTSDGIFPEDHVLAGDRWRKEVTLEDFLMGMIQVTKITYRITWTPKDGKGDQYFESSILGEVK